MTTWGYRTNNGPATWAKQFPVAEGPRQSPINIKPSEAKYDPNLQKGAPLTAKYQPEKELQIKNTGHSVTAMIKETSELTGGPLKGRYLLEQFHLHWGSEDCKGSEHTINGECYASELHLVHWNADKYKSFGEAADKPDGLAVIGIMIKIGNENAVFKAISDSLANVNASESTFTIPTPFDPSKLLPADISAYWTYEGSLTTPPLYESVQWIVLRDPIEFSKEQMQQLRSMKTFDGGCIQDNYRPPLDLKGRALAASFS